VQQLTQPIVLVGSNKAPTHTPELSAGVPSTEQDKGKTVRRL
jgi:hypothetical protein